MQCGGRGEGIKIGRKFLEMKSPRLISRVVLEKILGHHVSAGCALGVGRNVSVFERTLQFSGVVHASPKYLTWMT